MTEFHVILFNDLLLICKKRLNFLDGAGFKCKAAIPLAIIVLSEVHSNYKIV